MESRNSVIKEMCKKFESTNCSSNSHSENLELNIKPCSPNNQRASPSIRGCTPLYNLPDQNWSTPGLVHEAVQKKHHQDILKKPKYYNIDKSAIPLAKSNGSSRPNLTKKPSSDIKSTVADRMKLFERNNSETSVPSEIESPKVEYRSRSKSIPFTSTITPIHMDDDIHHATFAVARSDSNCRPERVVKPLSRERNYIPTPPKKPPRTFAHDKYVENKRNSPVKYQQPYLGRNCRERFENDYELYNTNKNPNLTPLPKNKIHTPVFVDLTSINLEPSKHYGTLKRSFSEEHVYAEPYEAVYMPTVKTSPIYAKPQMPKNKSRQNSLAINKQLYYMSTPIVGVDSAIGIKTPKKSREASLTLTPNRKGKATSSNVREIVNNSFNQLWKKLYTKGVTEGLDQNNGDDIGDSGSEVSMKDVEERIIYVKSLKSKIIGSAATEQKREKSNLFDCLLVSCLTPARKDSSPKARLIYKFPKQQETVYEQTMIPQLCFPDCTTIKCSTTYKSETFMFIVNDESGGQTFGFCLRLLGSPQVPKTAFLTLPAVVCLLTNRNSVGLYMKILPEIEKHLFLPQVDFQDYILRLYNTEVPMAGRIFWLPDKSEPNKNSRTQISRPTDNRIINTEVTHLLQFLEVELLLKVIASLLLERRVLLVADSSSTLFKCTTAILSLLYPLSWQYSVLPVLPESLLAQSCSSSPFLFGVSSHFVHKVVDIQREKILIVDLDQGFTLREVGDEHTILPSRSLKAVKFALSLAKNMTDPTEMLRDVMISEAFIRMFVETLGHCDDFIIEQNRGNFCFHKDGFCKYPSSKSVQMFLTWFCETLMFEAFIEERIKLKKTSSIRKQPGLSVPQGLFDRRLEEFWKQCHGSSGIKENVRELGKKVKIFGERLKGFKAF